jgi:hypothetical protein
MSHLVDTRVLPPLAYRVSRQLVEVRELLRSNERCQGRLILGFRIERD